MKIGIVDRENKIIKADDSKIGIYKLSVKLQSFNFICEVNRKINFENDQ